MSNDKSSNLHGGHRERMRQTIDKIGLTNLTEIQKLEYILTLCCPRKDTNELAHILLSEYGSISAVLDADVTMLSSVPGVNLRSAQILHSLPEIFNCYQQSKNKKITCKNFIEVDQYLRRIFADSEQEKVILIFIGKDNCIKGYEIMSTGSFCDVKFDIMVLTKQILKHNASSIMVAHNHPHGTANPSASDIDTNTKILQILTMINIKLIDNVIVGENDFYSFKMCQIIDLKK